MMHLQSQLGNLRIFNYCDLRGALQSRKLNHPIQQQDGTIKVKKSYKDMMVNYFKEQVGGNFDKINIITKSLILSLVPLHNDVDKIKKYTKLINYGERSL